MSYSEKEVLILGTNGNSEKRICTRKSYMKNDIPIRNNGIGSG